MLREIIRAKREDPAKYLKEEVISRKRSITKEEVKAYAKATWGVLKREVLEDVRSTPEKYLNGFISISPLAC